MSDPTDDQQSPAKAAVMSGAQQVLERKPGAATDLCIPPVTIPLSLLVTEPHPVLVQLQATHGGVPVPISAPHFSACIELARSIERSCATNAHTASPAKPADQFETRMNRASTPPRFSMTGPPRRIIPLSDPPSHAKRLSSSSSSATPTKTKVHPLADAKISPPPPKNSCVLSKTSRAATCAAATQFMTDVYAATKAYPLTPNPKPDLVAQLLKRNAELETEVRSLRSRVSDVEDEQKGQEYRMADLEDKLNDTDDAIVEARERIEAIGASHEQIKQSTKHMPALESKMENLEKNLASHKSTFDRFHVQVSQQVSQNTIGIDTLSEDVDNLYHQIQDEEEESELTKTLAKLNEEFEAKMKGWVGWTESLNRRVSKLEQCDVDDDWVDADIDQ